MNYFSSSENELISNIEGKIYIGGNNLYKISDNELNTEFCLTSRVGVDVVAIVTV